MTVTRERARARVDVAVDVDFAAPRNSIAHSLSLSLAVPASRFARTTRRGRRVARVEEAEVGERSRGRVMVRVVEREGAAASAAAAASERASTRRRAAPPRAREGRTPRGTTPELRSEREIEARSRGGARGNAVTSRRGLREESIVRVGGGGSGRRRSRAKTWNARPGERVGRVRRAMISRPSSRAGFERESGDAGERRGTTADSVQRDGGVRRDLIRSRVVEGDGDVELAREELRSMGQKDLQAMFVGCSIERRRATISGCERPSAPLDRVQELGGGGGEAHNAVPGFDGW